MSPLPPAARRLLPAAKIRTRVMALADRIVERTATGDPALAPLYGNMTDEQALVHFGDDDLMPERFYRTSVRVFHAWKVKTIRERLGDRLASAETLDMGDSDGLLLRDLGKAGVGFNISDAAVRNIRSNGVEAVQGDGHELPFDDAAFDVVFCFQTLEHVESQHAALLELARVCRPGGSCFVSIPGVPRTVVHARDFGVPRGQEHVFELSAVDFAALVTHTPFRVVFESSCNLFAKPRGLVEQLFVRAFGRRHVILGCFREFAFFELERQPDPL